MKKEKIICNVSGGETSMMLAVNIKEKLKDRDVVFIYANTGCENEETLEFIDKCDKHFGLGVVWVEAVTNPEHGKGVTHRVTNFEDAYRPNQYKDINHPFHAHIMKNGIPNTTYKQCSDRLKEFAIEHYKKVNQLKGVEHALGIRSDESHRAMRPSVRKSLESIGVEPRWFRCAGDNRFEYLKTNPKFTLLGEKEVKDIESYSKKLSRYNLVYPMCDWSSFIADKQDVNDFWEDQPFRLELESHEGNCQTCWKKDIKKLMLLAIERPERFEPFKWWESQYCQVKPNDDGKPRYFFRGHKSAEIILMESQNYEAKALRRMIGANADDQDGCTESCNGYSL